MLSILSLYLWVLILPINFPLGGWIQKHIYLFFAQGEKASNSTLRKALNHYVLVLIYSFIYSTTSSLNHSPNIYCLVVAKFKASTFHLEVP